MRICMLVYNPLARDARVFRQAKTLAEAGHELELIGWQPGDLPSREERDGFTILRIRRDPLHWRARRLLRGARHRLLRSLGRDPGPIGTPRRRKGLLHRQLMLFDWWRRAERLGLERRGDVYVAHDLNALPPAARAARKAGARLVYDSHELFIERDLVPAAERPLWRALEKRLIRRADRTMTVSEPIAEELARRYGVAAPTVIQNCPDPPERVPEDGERRLRNLAGVDDGEPLILYQGMVQPERGLEALVEAVPAIERGVVVIVGSGRLEGPLRQKVATMGIEARVKLTGEVPQRDLLSYTAGATIGVAPFEGRSLNSYWVAPNKLFEYMAVGVPVVASRLPVLERIVDGHGVGLLCEPGDAASLAAAVNRLLSDPELYERCHRNALAAAEVFNWRTESRKLMEIYDGLAEAA
jgi:glycosyltransferase involved in cell wall biosynthesis